MRPEQDEPSPEPLSSKKILPFYIKKLLKSEKIKEKGIRKKAKSRKMNKPVKAQG